MSIEFINKNNIISPTSATLLAFANDCFRLILAIWILKEHQLRAYKATAKTDDISPWLCNHFLS